MFTIFDFEFRFVLGWLIYTLLLYLTTEYTIIYMKNVHQSERSFSVLFYISFFKYYIKEMCVIFLTNRVTNFFACQNK